MEKSPNIGFTIAAFLVPLSIQAGRGTLVFFFQLNPARIQGKYSFGVIAASVLLLLSLIEAYFVMAPHGVGWIVSVSTLMIVGWVIEIMILKETIFSTQMELFQDKEKWAELKAFYLAQKEMENFLQGEIPQIEVETANEKALPPPEPANKEESKMLALLSELNEHLSGKEARPSLNGTVRGGKN